MKRFKFNNVVVLFQRGSSTTSLQVQQRGRSILTWLFALRFTFVENMHLLRVVEALSLQTISIMFYQTIQLCQILFYVIFTKTKTIICSLKSSFMRLF